MPEYDPNYLALQQSVQQMQAPRGMQREMLDLIPQSLAILSGDEGTQRMVQSMITRRETAKHLDFQNQLDLKKLQLDSGLKKLQADLSLLENTRQEAESKANILQSQASTRYSTAAAKEKEIEAAEAPAYYKARTAATVEEGKKQTALASKAEFEQQQEMLKLDKELTQRKIIEDMKLGTPEQRQLANNIELSKGEASMLNAIQDGPTKLEMARRLDPMLDILVTKYTSGNIEVGSQDESDLRDRIALAENPELAYIKSHTQKILTVIKNVKTQQGLLKEADIIKDKVIADGIKETVAGILAPDIDALIQLDQIENIKTNIFDGLQKQLAPNRRYRNIQEFFRHIKTKAKEQQFIKEKINELMPEPEDEGLSGDEAYQKMLQETQGGSVFVPIRQKYKPQFIGKQ